MRRRTLSCAMIVDRCPKYSFPPTWSPCQCVFRTKRTGLSVIPRSAAWIFSASGAN
jgi:hypothetical protein